MSRLLAASSGNTGNFREKPAIFRLNLQAFEIATKTAGKVLKRDAKVADFIRARKGEKYSTLLPLFGLHELEVAAENLRQLAKSVEQEAKLAQKHWEMEQTDSKRQQAFGDDTDELIESKIAEFHKTYCLASDRADGTTQCKELETELARRMNEQSAENQCYLALRALAQTDLGVSIQTVRDASSKLADSVEPLISEKLEVLQTADAFAAKVEAQDEVVCPACGRAIPAEQFKAHVKAEQARLEDIIGTFKERWVAIGTLYRQAEDCEDDVGQS
jgi:hypothetical protein